MSNIVYLTVTGEQQGSISAGCGTSESTGNRWQSGHEDETFTFSLLNNINNTGLGSQFHGITFCKLIDKSTPLFINSIEGFRDTAEKLGGDAIKGYDQILNEKTAGIAIATASILLTKRSNVDTYTEINSYLGKLRGQQKLLDGIDIIEIIYIKRPSKDLANLRKEFNKTVRKNFLIKLAKTSEASGRFNAEDLLRMRKGNVPLNYNVHHKLSLDDGGTNDFENLVLIENEPYHKVFTNMQSRIAKGILVGESKITPWAIPSGSIYPPMKNIMDHTK